MNDPNGNTEGTFTAFCDVSLISRQCLMVSVEPDQFYLR